ncbi:MAG: S8 family peptidase [Lachnospiraceae bacterium]|nr:S8 family peptidase [Lachnospiraceae bacterium]
MDYSHPAFIGSDGRTRILSIWDQTIQEPGEGKEILPLFKYGVEYTAEDINRALGSDDPLSIVPSRDEVGHGTVMAGVACGNQDEENEFSGMAPLATICMVKCKPAKQNLKDYYFVPDGVPCYSEGDLMTGIGYLERKAMNLGMPLIICLGMGTSLGGHNRGGMLGELMESTGDYRGIISVTSTGNEANQSNHYLSSSVEVDGNVEVELRVAEGDAGFTIELWADATDLYSVGLISPDGEYSGKTEARVGERRQINFLFENSVVYIDYLLNSFDSGDECIRLRFQNPAPGIWRIRVFNDNQYSSRFDMWLPLDAFLREGTQFLQPNPDTTICDPGNNPGVITCAYYNDANRSSAIDSGRGYTRVGNVKPDFSSPGVDILAPLPFAGNYPVTDEERNQRARYGYRTGASLGAAVTGGVTALLAQWAFIQENDIAMDTVKAKNYMIRGANREGLTIPNRVWGNGTLDLFGIFDNLRPKVR